MCVHIHLLHVELHHHSWRWMWHCTVDVQMLHESLNLAYRNATKLWYLWSWSPCVTPIFTNVYLICQDSSAPVLVNKVAVCPRWQRSWSKIFLFYVSLLARRLEGMCFLCLSLLCSTLTNYLWVHLSLQISHIIEREDLGALRLVFYLKTFPLVNSK